MPNIIFVPTAGGKKRLWWGGIELPRVATWSVFKWFYRPLGIRVELRNELKTETVARLEKALQLHRDKWVNQVFCAGGYSGSRSKSGLKGNAQMMKEWLVERGVPEHEVSFEAESSDTQGNVQNFAAYLDKWHAAWADEHGFLDSPVVYVVTSHYHMRRTLRAVKRALGEWPAAIFPYKAYPPFTYDCLMQEYLYNLLTEPFKWLVEAFPSLRGKYVERERLARDSYHSR